MSWLERLGVITATAIDWFPFWCCHQLKQRYAVPTFFCLEGVCIFSLYITTAVIKHFLNTIKYLIENLKKHCWSNILHRHSLLLFMSEHYPSPLVVVLQNVPRGVKGGDLALSPSIIVPMFGSLLALTAVSLRWTGLSNTNHKVWIALKSPPGLISSTCN